MSAFGYVRTPDSYTMPAITTNSAPFSGMKTASTLPKPLQVLHIYHYPKTNHNLLGEKIGEIPLRSPPAAHVAHHMHYKPFVFLRRLPPTLHYNKQGKHIKCSSTCVVCLCVYLQLCKRNTHQVLKRAHARVCVCMRVYVCVCVCMYVHTSTHTTHTLQVCP